MTNNIVCRALYFRNHVSYDLHLWYICMYNRIISMHFFFSFFQNFDFRYHLGGKKEKMTQNMSHFVSQEPYIIRLWVLIHFCKIIFLAIFFIFSKFWFFWFLDEFFGVFWVLDFLGFSGVFLYFGLKCNIVYINIILFFTGPLQQFFNKY